MEVNDVMIGLSEKHLIEKSDLAKFRYSPEALLSKRARASVQIVSVSLVLESITNAVKKSTLFQCHWNTCMRQL